jgi:hypothetical protein
MHSFELFLPKIYNSSTAEDCRMNLDIEMDAIPYRDFKKEFCGAIA